jgi:ParB/RepB/Spo0J family partition protein
MTTTTFAHIPLAHITASLTNPRKTFDAAKLADLTESIRASGVHQPILLRPLPGDRVAETDRAVQYEIVAGERRHRACQAAGLDTIPAMIRPLTDAQVLEIQIIENLQRDDLLELEEAEGYEALMRHSTLTADQVGEKIGKSRSYVYARLKLLDLCPEARTALRQRTIPASVALLVARIPDHKLQIKALGEITGRPDGYGGREAMSHRAAARHLQANYMLRLADARFPITAIGLLPQAGSCSTCPKRTGADPDLFADVKSADTCIDPACYHAKEEAHAAAQVQAAQAKGQTVIAGKEAAEMAIGNTWGPPKFKGYKRLDAAEDSPTNVPLRKIIGPILKAEGIQPTLIAHPRNAGEMVECLPNEVVSRLLKAVEGQAAAAKTVTKEVKALVDEKKAKAQAKAQHQYEQGWRDTLLEDTWYALRDDADTDGWSTDVHRLLALRAAHRLHQADATKLAELLALGQVAPQAALIDLVKTSPMPGRLHLLILMQEASSANDPDYPGHPANKALMLIAQAVWQDRLDTIIQEIKAEIHATVWPPADDAAGKNTSTPNAPAAQASRGAGEGAKKGTKPAGKKTARPAAPAAATVGEEEARQGIAAAMQSVEGGPPVADAQATPQPEGALAIGDKVKILPTATGKREARWVGKIGTVQGRVGPEAWDVSFTAKAARPITGKSIGHFQSFHVTELEVVES